MDDSRSYLTTNSESRITFHTETRPDGTEVDVYPSDSEATDSEAGIAPRNDMAKKKAPLRDARLDEPPTTEFTMTEFDRHTQKMDKLRAMWQEEEEEIKSSQQKPVQKDVPKTNSKSKRANMIQLAGISRQDYVSYHGETVATLTSYKEDLDALYGAHAKKRRALGKTISEKSSMVDLKAGNAMERMVEMMTMSTAGEIGNQAFREAGADRAMERGEEGTYDEAVIKARSRVGLEEWTGAGWWKKGD